MKLVNLISKKNCSIVLYYTQLKLFDSFVVAKSNLI